MGKLQPNFSWQKYEGKPEDQKEQFQYQLQQQHILVANAINTGVTDLSYSTAERRTAFTWIDGRTPIWTITLATQTWTAGGTVNTIPITIAPLSNGTITIINMVGTISDGNTFSNNTLLLPDEDLTVAANSVSIIRTGTNIILTSGGTDYSAYSGFVTLTYIKS